MGRVAIELCFGHGLPHRSKLGRKSEVDNKWAGPLLAEWMVPNAFEHDTKSEVAEKWVKWLYDT